MEAVLDFVPEEQREVHGDDGAGLFSWPEKSEAQNPCHRGAAGRGAASYPLKLLQIGRQAEYRHPGKDPVSGKHVTHEYTVEGPVMMFLTTTAPDVDEELMNRCLVLGERRPGADAGHPSQQRGRRRLKAPEPDVAEPDRRAASQRAAAAQAHRRDQQSPAGSGFPDT